VGTSFLTLYEKFPAWNRCHFAGHLARRQSGVCHHQLFPASAVDCRSVDVPGLGVWQVGGQTEGVNVVVRASKNRWIGVHRLID
jgi:hypothetical protein